MNVEEFLAIRKKNSQSNLRYWKKDIAKLAANSCTYGDMVEFLKINGVETTENAVGLFCRRHGLTKKKLAVATTPIDTCSADQPPRLIEEERRSNWDHSVTLPEHPSPATASNSPDADSQAQPKPTSLKPPTQNEGKRRVFLGRAVSNGAGNSRPKVESEALKRLREKSKLVPDYPSEMFSRARRERQESAGHGSDED